MTREEAINVLRNESVQISGDAVSVARWTSALDVAIRVLENVTDLKRKPCYVRCPYNTPKGCMVAETDGDCILEKVAEQLLVSMNGRVTKPEGGDGMICKFNTCGTCFNCYSKNFNMDCFPCEDADPMTNADHIRSMTDEELAEFIATTFENGRISVFAIYPELTENHCGLDWLQQPYGEEDKHESV